VTRNNRVLLLAGEKSNFFTAVFEHNGIFCGLDDRRTFWGSTQEEYDNCDANTWSRDVINCILQHLGYDITSPELQVYWLLPGKDILDGMVCLDNEEAIASMARAGRENRSLHVIVDERNHVKSEWDDLIYRGCLELPRVMTQRKMPSGFRPGEGTSGSTSSCMMLVNEAEPHSYVHREHEEEAEKGHGEATEDEHGERVEDEHVEAAEDEHEDGAEDEHADGSEEEHGEDSGTDEDFYESDYDVPDGDDDLFVQNVDESVNDHNEQKEYIDDEDPVEDDDDLNLSKKELERLKYSFKAFNPEVDLNNPIFRVGQVYGEMKELRAALVAYSVRNRVKINKGRNEATRLNASCSAGCPWLLKASKDNRTGSIVIKRYNCNHTCQKSWDAKCLSVKFLTGKFIEEFRDNQKMDLVTFGNKVQREFKVRPHKVKLGRARRAALDLIHGDEAAQYQQLWNYGKELRRSNPGSTFLVSTALVKENENEDPKDHLSSLYWSYDACKRGFLNGCRPIIFIDGCHLKSRYKGQLLTAVGIDPNDCIYPIAMGMVEVESKFSWEWFLTTLKHDLNIVNTSPFTIMSDKQKVFCSPLKCCFQCINFCIITNLSTYTCALL
jgi:hypothetical protein